MVLENLNYFFFFGLRSLLCLFLVAVLHRFYCILYEDPSSLLGR